MGRSSKAKPVRIEGLELYRSRPISRQAAERFPHILYYAVHFDEEVHKFAFLFLGADASRDEPDVLLGLEALAQWNRFVDVMTRDPVVSGLRVERIGSHREIQECVAAAQTDAAGFRPSGSDAGRQVPASADGAA
jgi:hypothetical protein